MTGSQSKIFTILVALVMIGVIFGVMTDSRNSILIKEIVYVAGAAVAALIAGIFILSGKHGRFSRIPSLPLTALGAIILYSAIRYYTGLSSVNGPFTIYMLLSLSILTVTSLIFIANKDIRLVSGIFVSACVVLFVYSILQWQGINLFPWDAGLTKSGRSAGSLGNPNLLGGFASASIPFGIAFLLSLRKRSILIKLLLSLLFTVLALLAIVASGTRGSLIGLSTGCFALTAWYIRTKRLSMRKVVTVVAVLAALLAAGTIPMMSRLSELDPGAEDQGTLQVRKVIWSGGWAVFLDDPVFGHGPGSFQILFPAFRNPDYSLLGVSHNTLHTHCEYLEILVDLGIIGLLLWSIVLISLAKGFKTCSPLMAGAFAGLMAMLFEALVSVHLRWPPTAWLFAFFATVLLAEEREPEKPGRWAVFYGVILLAVSGVLTMGLIDHYLPESKASELVFMGKDVYLNKTEAAMQNAYSAAGQWQTSGDPAALNATLNYWSYATAYADSAVEYSRRATLVYPRDLGAWYSLGSAHLTRYMVMNPPVTAIVNALDHAGCGVDYTDQQLSQELALGMAAYDSLVAMAPNYAEVHNNLSLGYSNMGLVDQSLAELYSAYLLHGHRRADYVAQASSLLPLSPGSVPGTLLLFRDRLAGLLAAPANSRTDSQMEGLTAFIEYADGYLAQEKDSLNGLFMQIAGEELDGDLRNTVQLTISEAAGGTLFSSWYSGAVGNAEPSAVIGMLYWDHVYALYNGRLFPGQLPADRDFYVCPAEALFRSGMNSDVFQDLMVLYLYQIAIDRSLDDTFTLMYSDRFRGKIPEELLLDLNEVRTAMGGSRTALRGGIDMPWLEGSLPGVVSDSLQSLERSDSLNSIWYEMEMEIAFQMVTSYWWDYNIFSFAQNQYLLQRIFFCRDMIRELNPDSWQTIISELTERVLVRIEPFTGGICPLTVDLLRDDLISGTERTGV